MKSTIEKESKFTGDKCEANFMYYISLFLKLPVLKAFQLDSV